MLRSYLERRAERLERRALEQAAARLERLEHARRWAELACGYWSGPAAAARALEREQVLELAERLRAGAQA